MTNKAARLILEEIHNIKSFITAEEDFRLFLLEFWLNKPRLSPMWLSNPHMKSFVLVSKSVLLLILLEGDLVGNRVLLARVTEAARTFSFF